MNLTDSGREVGFVTRAKQYVLFLEGLPSAKINDIIVDEEGNRAMVRALADGHLVAHALDAMFPRAGERFTLPPERYRLSIGTHLFGRVIDALCEPVDGGKKFPVPSTPYMLDINAPGIDARAPMREQLYTGVTIVDTLLPIAKGQRQLLFGGGHAGKTSFLTDVVLNQAKENTVCIYAAIGKSLSELERISETILGGRGGSKNIVLAALSDQVPPRIAIAPSIAFLIADYFQRKGEHVLVILDDLDAHAKYLREIALLEERLPGRESYPGDVFYQHAHLMERSGYFSEAAGGGSITALPVVETDNTNFSNIIPTNLMACTDGHLSFIPTLQGEGVYPAISEAQSVTRVGRRTQTLIQKQLSTRVRMLLAAYVRQREYAEFGAQLSEETRAALNQGELLECMLRQDPFEHIASDVQVALVALTLTPFLQKKDAAFCASHKKALTAAIATMPALQKLRELGKKDTPLEEYLSHLNSKEEVFEYVCRE